MKKCMKCGEVKPVDDFYRHPKMADGRLSKCKTCTKRDVRENRAKRVEYYRAADRARSKLPHRRDAEKLRSNSPSRIESRRKYALTPEGRASANRAKKSYCDRNPVKRAAHVACGNAIRDGRLIRKPCEVCGEIAQAHHDDYSKPLDVRWLCTKHHVEWHKHNTPICPLQE